MSSDASRKRKLSDGAEASQADAPAGSSSNSLERFRRRRQETDDAQGPGRRYQDTTIAGSSRSQLGDVYAGTVNNIYNTSSSKDQTEDEKGWASFKKALAFDRMELRQATIDPAYGATCQWVLETDEYRRWRDESYRQSHHGFLWIKGKPGVGKSTIMKFLFEHMKLNMPGYTVISFFFNARGVQLEKSVVGLWRSLLLQLLEKFRMLQDVLRVSHSMSEGQDLAVGIVQNLFREAMLHLKQERIILVIDALDEGDHKEVRNLVRCLEGLMKETCLQDSTFDICFASRHFPKITIQAGEELAVEGQDSHMDDIQKYVSENLTATARQIDLVRKIAQKSRAVFLWVVLVVRLLNEQFDEGATLEQLRDTLDATPPELDDLLSVILQAGASDRYFLPALHWVLAWNQDFGDLGIPSLYFGIRLAVGGLKSPFWDRDALDLATMMRFILNSSKGLIEWSLPKRRDEWLLARDRSFVFNIRFIHETVRQHLIDGGMQRLNPLLGDDVMASSHAMLAECCQAYVRLDMGSWLCASTGTTVQSVNASTPGLGDAEVWSSASEMFPLLRYTQWNTFDHIKAAHTGGAYDLNNLQGFPLQEWIDITNAAKFLRQHLQPSTNVLYLLLYHDCLDLARELLMRYQPWLNRANIDKSGIDAVEDCCTRALVGSSVNVVCGTSCGTPLMAAIAGSDPGLVNVLLEFGADVNLASECGSPLSIATEYTDLDMIRHFLDLGAAVNIQDNRRGGPLAAAAYFGDISKIQLLLERGADINATGGPHGSALGTAAYMGDLKGMKLLLEHGADVNEKGGTECSIALKQAATAVRPDHAAMELLLSDPRARFTAQDLNTCLLVASKAAKAFPIPCLCA